MAGSDEEVRKLLEASAEVGPAQPVKIGDGTNATIKTEETATTPVLSKNQQKKLKRKQQWEETRDSRKVRRKEKVKEKKVRKRIAQADPNYVFVPKPSQQSIQLPITIVIDCQFDELMTENERNSLASQLTRCYSDNKKAMYRAHMVISSFSGELKKRFENVLHNTQQGWRNVRVLEDDFVKVSKDAEQWMAATSGGRLVGAFQDIKDDPPKREVVYLTSDSANTLTELKPHSTYIIGGIVDKNRHKGICYKKAMDAGMKTAKLPIGEYLKMQSRAVLTTNHVNEIMLKWLECRDWGKAFMEVMPKRKEAVLRNCNVEGSGESSDMDTVKVECEDELGDYDNDDAVQEEDDYSSEGETNLKSTTD